MSHKADSSPGGRTIIVGAGIVGLSTAYALARRGHDVCVLDRDDADDGASAGNAGIIAPGHPPLPQPGLVLKGLRWMFDSSGPLYIPPRPDPALLGWLVGFARACGPSRFERSIRVLADLGRHAHECIQTILDEESIECSHEPAGWLELYLSDSSLKHGRAAAELVGRSGYEVDELGREELHDREPALGSRVCGAHHFRKGASIHPGRLLAGLAGAAGRHGAELRHGATVTEFISSNGRVTGVACDDGRRFEGDTVVLAAGSWTTGLARAAGLRVPMQPGKGYHVRLPDFSAGPSLACVLADHHIAATPMGDHLRLAGTVELSGLNHRLVPRRVEMLTEGALPYLPSVAEATPSEGWCGLRPCTADGLPVIGWAPGRPGLFIATGHAKMGLTLGPITGRLVAEWLLDGHPSMDLSAMGPERFAR